MSTVDCFLVLLGFSLHVADCFLILFLSFEREVEEAVKEAEAEIGKYSKKTEPD
jgi:hypothetical protein